MKKFFILLLTLFLFGTTTSLFAQNPGGGMQQMMHSYLKDSVHLSDALTDSVISIRKQYQPQLRNIFMDQSLSSDDKQAKMKDIRSEMESRFKSAGLTDDQIKMIREHEQRMREQMRSRNGGNQ
jgi:hypothetical protein